MPNNSLSSFLSSLNKAHLRYDDIAEFFEIAKHWDDITIEQVGHSFEQRPINLLSMGSGSIKVFAWTQMHGDEASASAAVFDLIAQLIQSPPSELKDWKTHFTIHILPMLNPDGAQQQTRENAQGIDINRDALSLQSPEGKLLFSLVRKLSPNLAFNLHDQSSYYQAGYSGKPATIAFLAPAFNEQKDIDPARELAMKTIAAMNTCLQQYIPACIARYDDEFSARSFGDNIAALGISTILIESGAAPQDPNRQIARQMNVKAILSALEYQLSLLSPSVNERYSLKDYFSIPENVADAMSSLLIKDLNFTNGTYQYKADVSIKQSARYSNYFHIDFIGDSGVQSGFEIFKAEEYCYVPGKVFEVRKPLRLDFQTYASLLKQAYIVFDDPFGLLSVDDGIDVCREKSIVKTENSLSLQQAAYCLLAKTSTPNDVSKALINGKLVDLI